jgi:hypothetical protein
MVNDQDKETINKVISRNAVIDLYNLEESRRNISRLVGSCSSSPAVANYARMSLSFVYRPRFLGHRIEPYAASAAD